MSTYSDTDYTWEIQHDPRGPVLLGRWYVRVYPPGYPGGPLTSESGFAFTERGAHRTVRRLARELARKELQRGVLPRDEVLA